MSLTFIDGKYNSICLGKHSPGEMNPSVASLVESNVLLSVYRLWQSKALAVLTTSTCPACRVMELSNIANRAANEATQYFCKAIRCTEMPWLTPKFLMQCGCQLIDNLALCFAFSSLEAKSVINTNRVDPDPSPRFFLLISVS